MRTLSLLAFLLGAGCTGAPASAEKPPAAEGQKAKAATKTCTLAVLGMT